MTQTASTKLLIPPTPRPLTRRVTRRSWAEGKVRFWWTSALVVSIVLVIVGSDHFTREMKHRRLVENGIAVTGVATKVQWVTAAVNKGYAVQRDQPIDVEFTVKLPGKEDDVILKGYLEPADGYIRVNDKVPLRVDPTDLSWTDQLDLKPWWQVLAVPIFILLPIGLFFMGIAELRRRGVLSVWRNGMRSPGVVTDIRQTAAAPRSRVVRYTTTDGRDRRVFATLWPVREGIPQPGQDITLIHPADRLQNSIIAELYARTGDQPTGS